MRVSSVSILSVSQIQFRESFGSDKQRKLGSLRNHDGNGNGNVTEQKNKRADSGCARAL